ncbi:AP-3 complex subunit sigma-2 isoform X2 [Papio anubis]|uniref:AP-3 complex subunit sigma-2 isoform X2 n=1 Tax=Papio anubis TaxID=9555 RepID=UPI000B7B958E|nr:AP-3 complex subunit sigma-2 isoform X2 [Papio anubis]
MIQAILVFNNHGKPRLVRFYQRFPEEIQQQIVRETFHLVLKRDDNICNFLEGGSLIGGSDYKLIYRHYATLYFVFCVDSSESELGILDLIQVFVETLDKCFENVCELDLIFHMDKCNSWVIDEASRRKKQGTTKAPAGLQHWQKKSEAQGLRTVGHSICHFVR